MHSDIVVSIGVFVLLSSLAHVATRIFTKNQPLAVKRFWQLTFRNTAMVAGVIMLGAIWRTELQSVFLALGAAAAGIFVAFREAWLSLLAFWLRMVKRHYSVGDYIEVDGIRGRVVDITWQHTVLAESTPGNEPLPFSGRQAQIPNHKMLLHSFTVENMTGTYTPHVLKLPLPCGANVLSLENLIVDLAITHCKDFKDAAMQHMETYQRTHYVEAPSVDPKTNIILSENGSLSVLLRIVVPAQEKMEIEQKILHDFFAKVPSDIWPPTGKCK